LVEVFNRDGIDASLEFTTPDVEVATAPGFPGGGRFRGREAAGNFLKEFVEAWDHVRYEVTGAKVVEGCVVHAARWVVRAKGSGAEVDLDFFGVARFEGDLVSALELFWTEAEATAHARGAS
jgi:SnoaL-like domain